MDICVIGTGYVGLVAGTCLSDMGNNVICVDNNQEKIDKLNDCIVPIFEPGLDELISLNKQEGRLSFSTDLKAAVEKSKVCFIAVGTPQDETGNCDLSFIYKVAEQIAKSINEYKVIVNKSTVPVGTLEKISDLIKQFTKYDFDIVSNPEFLKQGSAVDDFLSPDRVIIGTNSDRAKKIMQEIYSPFMKISNRIIFMDIKSAEMSKYASNAFLATKISFINEIANLCEKTGADIEKVRLGMISDNRIGKKFLYPGIGYGGSCFPKDVEALINMAQQAECDVSIIKSVKEINNNQRKIFINKILNYFSGNIKDKTFAIWGLAFKPKTNDMREAPSVTVINSLLKKNAKVRAFDPKAMKTARDIFGDNILYAKNAYNALEGADALLLLTEWNEFRYPDINKMKLLMNDCVIFDARYQYDIETMRNMGVKYIR